MSTIGKPVGAPVTDDTRRLSQRPRQIRNRLNRKGPKGHHAQRLHEDYSMLVEIGEIRAVEDWDLEELAKGRPRNKHGGFAGGSTPRWMTPIIQEEVKRRFRDQVFTNLTGYAELALKAIGRILTDSETDENGKRIVNHKLRFDAAKLVLEYTVGKPQATVILSGNVELESILAGALVLDSGQDAHPVIEGVASEEEFEDDDDEEL